MNKHIMFILFTKKEITETHNMDESQKFAELDKLDI